MSGTHLLDRRDVVSVGELLHSCLDVCNLVLQTRHGLSCDTGRILEGIDVGNGVCAHRLQLIEQRLQFLGILQTAHLARPHSLAVAQLCGTTNKSCLDTCTRLEVSAASTFQLSCHAHFSRPEQSVAFCSQLLQSKHCVGIFRTTVHSSQLANDIMRIGP